MHESINRNAGILVEVSQLNELSMSDLVWELPLFNNSFLSMQGQNIMLIDFYLRGLEGQLLRDLIERERTPPDTPFVSALSQMWIFAAYELLRTWRQSISEMKKARKDAPADDLRTTNLVDWIRRGHLEQFRSSEDFCQDVETAAANVEPVFRRIEALRMNLAKHEVPKSKKNELAAAPGYSRIDGSDGSIYWMVDLGNNEVDMMSRRSLSDQLRCAVIGRTLSEDDDALDDDSESGQLS